MNDEKNNKPGAAAVFAAVMKKEAEASDMPEYFDPLVNENDGTQMAYSYEAREAAARQAEEQAFKEGTAFCTACGARLMPDNCFCTECGSPVRTVEQAEAAAPPAPPVVPEVKKPGKTKLQGAPTGNGGNKKSKTGLIIGIAAGALCLLLGILAIAGVFGGKSSDKPQEISGLTTPAAKTQEAEHTEAYSSEAAPVQQTEEYNYPEETEPYNTEANESTETAQPGEQLATDDYVTSGTFYIRSAATGEYLGPGGVKTNTSTGKSGYYFKLVTDRGKAISFSPCEVNGNTCRLLSGWIQGGGNYYLEAFNSTKSLTGADIWGKGRDIDQIWILEKQWDGTYCIYLASNYSMLLTLGDSGKGDLVCVTGINYTDEQKWELVLLGE